MSRFGISDKIWQSIIDICFSFDTVQRVILYGSRARGDATTGSDIDLAIDAPTMHDQDFSRLWNQLDDLPIIYSIDVVHIQSLKNKDLLDAIKREGCLIIER